jgi:ribosomal-protein-alanine N-acetyltransferase
MLIETPRLIVRELTMDDLEVLTEIYADEETMRFIGRGGVLTREHARRSIERELANYAERGFGEGATVLRETGETIGICGLIVWPDIDGVEELEVAYLLARPWWGQGLATEVAGAIRDHARGQLGRDRLVSCIYPDNAASIRVADKIGMRYEKDFDWAGHTLSLYTSSHTAATNV